jgi:hypothetical protein
MKEEKKRKKIRKRESQVNSKTVTLLQISETYYDILVADWVVWETNGYPNFEETTLGSGFLYLILDWKSILDVWL